MLTTDSFKGLDLLDCQLWYVREEKERKEIEQLSKVKKTALATNWHGDLPQMPFSRHNLVITGTKLLYHD